MRYILPIMQSLDKGLLDTFCEILPNNRTDMRNSLILGHSLPTHIRMQIFFAVKGSINIMGWSIKCSKQEGSLEFLVTYGKV